MHKVVQFFGDLAELNMAAYVIHRLLFTCIRFYVATAAEDYTVAIQNSGRV